MMRQNCANCKSIIYSDFSERLCSWCPPTIKTLDERKEMQRVRQNRENLARYYEKKKNPVWLAEQIKIRRERYLRNKGKAHRKNNE